jgi:hypothetical protein
MTWRSSPSTYAACTQDCKEALVKIRLAFHAKQKRDAAVVTNLVGEGTAITVPLDDEQQLMMMVAEGDDVEAALMMMETSDLDPLGDSDGLHYGHIDRVLEGSEGGLDMMEVDVLGLGSQGRV